MNNIQLLMMNKAAEVRTIRSFHTTSLELVGYPSSDNAFINVTPDTMSTTTTLVNTGDNILWLTLDSASAQTGDFNLLISTGFRERLSNASCEIHISDDLGGADTLVITVNYTYVP